MGGCLSKINNSKLVAKQPHKQTSNPSTNTILGKPYEDVNLYYSIGRELGRGGLGITYLCTENSTGIQFACKSTSKSKLLTESDKDDVKREIQIMQRLSGRPNIVEFKDVYEDEQSVHLIMELCAGGELFDRIVSRGHYTERSAALVCRVIVNAIQTCHSMGVIHRDIKPENFLFSNKEENAPLKAIDFGVSVFIEEGKVYEQVVGSPYYVAPEVLQRSYGKEVDIWSAGIILYTLLCGVPPFRAEMTEMEKGVFQATLQGDIDFKMEPWPSVSSSAKDLVCKMLTRDPKTRITCDEALAHPWLRVVGSISYNRPL